MMVPATRRLQSSCQHRLLMVNRRGHVSHGIRSDFPDLLRPGDLVIANDAATLPASLSGVHVRTGRPVEIRLAGRESLNDVRRFEAVVFGEGDFRTVTENRPLPPLLMPGDELLLGPLHASVVAVNQHPRLITLQFAGASHDIWDGLVRHGRPIQYAHVRDPLAVWDTWTAIAGPPVAFEAPSAGFMIDWDLLAALPAKGVHFRTITHAAGISSTGDPALDAMLPFDEPYRIPAGAASAVAQTKANGGRVVAIGTTVVRALEHAARHDGVVRPGSFVATQKIGRSTRLRAVNAIVSGVHEPGTSHHELLRAFADERTLAAMDEQLALERYRTHEFGDSVFIEAARLRVDESARLPAFPPRAAPRPFAHDSM